MIYFDNAATTWPKPRSVIEAVSDSMKYLAANPGRSGHKMAISAGEAVYKCREDVAEFFGIDNPCNVVFTQNATYALNIVINGILKEGDHVICTCMDHNSVLRPVYSKEGSIEISCVGANSEGVVESCEIESCIKANTKLIVMTHVSNVCGSVEPVKEVSTIAKKHSIPFLLDASQSAGLLKINMKEYNIDFLAAPGHKALYGPMGTGILCINSEIPLVPVITGGTGSNSYMLTQPEEMPDHLESGTLNLPGICGLRAGLSFVNSIGTDNILKHELKLTGYFIEELSKLKDFRIIGKNTLSGRCGVVSVVHSKKDSAEIAEYLSSSYNIATRAMYHCAYLSHKTLGTENGGALRISFGIFNTLSQLKTLLYALEHI